MQAKWPDLPPFKAVAIVAMGTQGKEQVFVADHEGIQKLKAYVAALEESMNS